MKTLTILLVVVFFACSQSKTTDEKRNNSNELTTNPNTAIISIQLFDTTIVSGFNGDTLNQINRSLKLISNFDSLSTSFSTDTFDVYEHTTEGCEVIIAHHSKTEYVKFYGTCYGEMGQKEFSFYVYNGKQPKFSCVIFNERQYDKPIYEEGFKVKEAITTYEIYADNKLIAILDENKIKQPKSAIQLKEKEKLTKDFFIEYIGRYKFIK